MVSACNEQKSRLSENPQVDTGDDNDDRDAGYDDGSDGADNDGDVEEDDGYDEWSRPATTRSPGSARSPRLTLMMIIKVVVNIMGIFAAISDDISITRLVIWNRQKGEQLPPSSSFETIIIIIIIIFFLQVEVWSEYDYDDSKMSERRAFINHHYHFSIIFFSFQVEDGREGGNQEFEDGISDQYEDEVGQLRDK